MRNITLPSLKPLGVAFIVLFSLALSQNALSVSDYRFQKENLALIRDVKDVLEKNGLCPNASCKDIVLTEPTSWGVDVEVYGIVDPVVIKKIDSICAEYFYKVGSRFSVKLRFFSVTKETEVKSSFFSKPKPIVTINREHTDVEH